eukprot:COSAG02_NODE_1575_length_11877_cov_43.830871_3_plen_449_part_00
MHANSGERLRSVPSLAHACSPTSAGRALQKMACLKSWTAWHANTMRTWMEFFCARRWKCFVPISMPRATIWQQVVANYMVTRFTHQRCNRPQVRMPVQDCHLDGALRFTFGFTACGFGIGSNPCSTCAVCERDDVHRCACFPGRAGTTCGTSTSTVYDPSRGEQCAHTSLHVVYNPPEEFAEAITFQLLGPLVPEFQQASESSTGNTVVDDTVVLGDFHNREGYHNNTHEYRETLLSHTFPHDMENAVYEIWLCNLDPGLYLFEVSDFHPQQEECITNAYDNADMGEYQLSLSYANSSAVEIAAAGEGGIVGDVVGGWCYEDNLFFICPDETNNCGSSPCQNGAECLEACREYVCVCVDGFEGQDCQLPADNICEDPNTCRNGGSCDDLFRETASSPSHTCTCVAGWAGEDCSTQVATTFDPENQECAFPWLKFTVRPNKQPAWGATG